MDVHGSQIQVCVHLCVLVLVMLDPGGILLVEI
jgi:hypothetical protein